ncbi:hypothetical protein [Caulobacter radicis]|nr:hypothetical protein [Caulobacter radicis]
MLFSSGRHRQRLVRLGLVHLGKASGLTRAVMDLGDREPLVAMHYWP